MAKKAIIIGAGPAGLTAAYELLKRTDIQPIILEKSGDIGGISKTINYKGNRMDIGGHRFFSKSDRVMNWWMNIMPLQQTEDETVTINYQNKSRKVNGSAYGASANTGSDEYATATSPSEKVGKVMLLRKRLSRIYFLRKFFTYPIQLSIDTLRKLGIARTIHILLSYIYAQLVPRKPEKSLEDFLINRFGRQLYLLFFKDYTEKVWGVPCHEISAEWGAQRIKGVSISKAIKHAAQMMVKKKQKASGDIAQKDTETSLIEQFLYPALGPGQLWEEVARQVVDMGGEIIHYEHVKEIASVSGRITGITAVNTLTGEETLYEGDYFFSTMPIKELIAGMNSEVPADVKTIAAGLQYRDFITVGVLLEKLCATNPKTGETTALNLQDTWIYIQEKDVKVGRLQLFNNWSPYMVNKPGNVWIGMEYFCNEGDEFWALSDEEIKRTAVAELEKMGLAQVEDVLDSTVHRVEKTYPAYFGTYDRFDRIREFVDEYENLFLVGRNGMHKYNNADHSMLTAMTAVDNIVARMTEKANVWAINTEQEYHEEKKADLPTLKKVNYINKSLSKIMDAIYKPGNHLISQHQYEKTHDVYPTLKESFTNYLFKNKLNKKILIIIGIILLVELIVFKYFYPYASYINGDSYTYLRAAFLNLNLSTYPIGYSKFLRLFSVFSNSDTALISFQYFVLYGCNLFLLYTIFYFYRPNQILQYTLLTIILLNPVFFYISNYISSDSIFISLSLIWLSILVWILNRPTQKLILLHGLVILLCFIVRYNALYYPLISAIAFFLSKQKIISKLKAIALTIALISSFVIYTSFQFYNLTGIRQFSPFSGWQLANNALYAYRYVDSFSIKSVPPRFRDLDNMVRTYFDTSRNLSSHPIETVKASTAYMWDQSSPLQIYMKNKIRIDSTDDYNYDLKKWALAAPLYSDYGAFLISNYSNEFFKNYLSINILKYCAPPVEFLESYSTGVDTVKQIAAIWFGYKSNKLTTRLNTFNVSILNFYPILCGIINIAFIFSGLFFFVLKGHKTFPQYANMIILALSFWAINFVFSVFASPIALRFQIFPIIFFTIIICFFF